MVEQVPRINELVLWGAGGQALVLSAIIRDFELVLKAIFLDDPVETELCSTVVAGSAAIEHWVSRRDNHGLGFAVAIGGDQGQTRLDKIYYLQNRGLIPRTLIHSTATVMSNDMGNACQLLAGSILGVRASLGDGVILNTRSSVDHECQLGHGVHIGPGATLAGRVRVGDRTFIGTGASVCPDLSIVPDCTIGAGTVVTRSLTETGTYVGCPARRVR